MNDTGDDQGVTMAGGSRSVDTALTYSSIYHEGLTQKEKELYNWHIFASCVGKGCVQSGNSL